MLRSLDPSLASRYVPAYLIDGVESSHTIELLRVSTVETCFAGSLIIYLLVWIVAGSMGQRHFSEALEKQFYVHTPSAWDVYSALLGVELGFSICQLIRGELLAGIPLVVTFLWGAVIVATRQSYAAEAHQHKISRFQIFRYCLRIFLLGVSLLCSIAAALWPPLGHNVADVTLPQEVVPDFAINIAEAIAVLMSLLLAIITFVWQCSNVSTLDNLFSDTVASQPKKYSLRSASVQHDGGSYPPSDFIGSKFSDMAGSKYTSPSLGYQTSIVQSPTTQAPRFQISAATSDKSEASIFYVPSTSCRREQQPTEVIHT